MDPRRNGFKSFEEIEAWQQARLLTRDIYQITSAAPFASDFALRDQLRRTSISIMSNIAEGFARRRPREFVQFLGYAKASCAEVQSQLYAAMDIGDISAATSDELRTRTDLVARLIYGLIRYLESFSRSTPRRRPDPPT